MNKQQIEDLVNRTVVAIDKSDSSDLKQRMEGRDELKAIAGEVICGMLTDTGRVADALEKIAGAQVELCTLETRRQFPDRFSS